jgi:hypothetical protein
MDATRVGPSRSRLVRIRGGLVLLGCLAAAACAINPATGKNQLTVVSEEQRVAMGRQADTAVIATIGLHPDAARQTHIQQFGERLAATSERPDLPWTCRVVGDLAVNALRACRGTSTSWARPSVCRSGSGARLDGGTSPGPWSNRGRASCHVSWRRGRREENVRFARLPRSPSGHPARIGPSDRPAHDRDRRRIRDRSERRIDGGGRPKSDPGRIGVQARESGREVDQIRGRAKVRRSHVVIGSRSLIGTNEPPMESRRAMTEAGRASSNRPSHRGMKREVVPSCWRVRRSATKTARRALVDADANLVDAALDLALLAAAVSSGSSTGRAGLAPEASSTLPGCRP